MTTRWSRPMIPYGLNVNKTCGKQKRPEVVATIVVQCLQDTLYKLQHSETMWKLYYGRYIGQ